MLRFIFAVISLIITHLALCQSLQGKVIRISDGDTITLLDSTNKQIRVRLYGIDCPENGQDFANVAKRFTSDLCFAKTITVDVKDIDRYGRTVGVVWTPDSINVNLELLHDKILANNSINKSLFIARSTSQ